MIYTKFVQYNDETYRVTVDTMLRDNTVESDIAQLGTWIQPCKPEYNAVDQLIAPCTFQYATVCISKSKLMDLFVCQPVIPQNEPVDIESVRKFGHQFALMLRKHTDSSQWIDATMIRDDIWNQVIHWVTPVQYHEVSFNHKRYPQFYTLTMIKDSMYITSIYGDAIKEYLYKQPAPIEPFEPFVSTDLMDDTWNPLDPVSIALSRTDTYVDLDAVIRVYTEQCKEREKAIKEAQMAELYFASERIKDMRRKKYEFYNVEHRGYKREPGDYTEVDLHCIRRECKKVNFGTMNDAWV